MKLNLLIKFLMSICFGCITIVSSSVARGNIKIAPFEANFHQVYGSFEELEDEGLNAFLREQETKTDAYTPPGAPIEAASAYGANIASRAYLYHHFLGSGEVPGILWYSIYSLWRIGLVGFNYISGHEYRTKQLPRIVEEANNNKDEKQLETVVILPSYGERLDQTVVTFRQIAKEALKSSQKMTIVMAFKDPEEFEAAKSGILKELDPDEAAKRFRFIGFSQVMENGDKIGKRGAVLQSLYLIRKYVAKGLISRDAVLAFMDGDSVPGKNSLALPERVFRRFKNIGALTVGNRPVILNAEHEEEAQKYQNWFDLKALLRAIDLEAWSYRVRFLPVLTGRLAFARLKYFLDGDLSDLESKIIEGPFDDIVLISTSSGDDKSNADHYMHQVEDTSVRSKSNNGLIRNMEEWWKTFQGVSSRLPGSDMIYLSNVDVANVEELKPDQSAAEAADLQRVRWTSNSNALNQSIRDLGPMFLGAWGYYRIIESSFVNQMTGLVPFFNIALIASVAGPAGIASAGISAYLNRLSMALLANKDRGYPVGLATPLLLAKEHWNLAWAKYQVKRSPNKYSNFQARHGVSASASEVGRKKANPVFATLLSISTIILPVALSSYLTGIDVPGKSMESISQIYRNIVAKGKGSASLPESEPEPISDLKGIDEQQTEQMLETIKLIEQEELKLKEELKILEKQEKNRAQKKTNSKSFLEKES